MKNRLLKIPMLLMIPFVTGCSIGGTRIVREHTTALMSTSNMTGSSISFSCKKCDGETVYEIKVKENTDLNIYSNVKIEDGTLTIVIMDVTEEEQYYQKVSSESMDYQVALPESGKYRIGITHESFKGSYKFSWNK